MKTLACCLSVVICGLWGCSAEEPIGGTLVIKWCDPEHSAVENREEVRIDGDGLLPPVRYEVTVDYPDRYFLQFQQPDSDNQVKIEVDPATYAQAQVGLSYQVKAGVLQRLSPAALQQQRIR